MNPSKVSANRYALLDELRGLDLISMMCYHGLWDVVFLFGVQLPWYTGMPGHLWQQSICWGFILLSGFCLPMGHHMYKRGALVFGAGALVTAVTVLFMPEDVVLFGVLTLLGSAMVLLPRFLYQNLFTAYLGFYPEGFFSTDYFPLVPWLFLFWSGFFLYHLIGRERMEPLHHSICPALGWLGRHSLVVYLLHQPVLYGVLNFGFYLLR